MDPKTVLIGARVWLCAATVAGALVAGNVAAKDIEVTDSLQVSAKGLNVNEPAGAQAFYTRLQNAAWVVCTRGTQVNLLPTTDKRGCYEQALGGAVRSARMPMITQIYLSTHSLQEAAAHGIEVPAQVAAK